MKKKALQVTLDVGEPSVVELTLGERVQLDRLSAPHGRCLAERHGNLLAPGIATIALEPGLYFFKTLSDANLKIVRGAVSVTAGTGGKQVPPPPASSPDTRGDELSGEAARLSIT